MAVACPDAELQWFALKVRTRAEKSAEEFLNSRGFEVLSPTYLERRKYSDRVKTLQSPLFPGYLFCKMKWTNRFPVVSAPNVEYVVGSGGDPAPVPESDMSAVRSLVQSAALCQPHPFLYTGQRVRLQSGPLANLEGILVSVRGVHRLVVSVDLLQRSVATEIDAADVCPL